MRKSLLAFVTAAILLVMTPALAFAAADNVVTTQDAPLEAQAPGDAITSPVEMHRLYNPNSGEHFYTADLAERDNLIRLGWKYEGIGWMAPVESDYPVFRLYNPNAGEHHYTLDASERDMLVNAGWKYEGIGWYSDPNKKVPLYRVYNPNEFANNHHYTADNFERGYLIALGWRDESIAWYGIS